MKTHLVILLFLPGFFFAGTLKGQDIIYLKNGDSLRVHLATISSDSVWYSLPDDSAKTLNVMPVSSVRRIQYVNGTTDTFNNKVYDTQTAVQKRKIWSELMLTDSITYQPGGRYLYRGLPLSSGDLQYLFNLSDRKELRKAGNNAAWMKGFSFMTGFTAIPVALMTVYFWEEYALGRKEEPRIQAILSTVLFAGLESGFVYFTVRHKQAVRRAVNQYNSFVKRHEVR